MTPWVALFCSVLWGAGSLVWLFTASIWFRSRDAVMASMSVVMVLLFGTVSALYAYAYIAAK